MLRDASPAGDWAIAIVVKQTCRRDTELLESTLHRKQSGHRIAKSKRAELFDAIFAASEERVITLIGPSGVGKSHIKRNVEAALIDYYSDQMREDPGFLPFISATTVSGLNGSFDWRDAFTRLLNAANEPLVGLKKPFHTGFERALAGVQLDGRDIATTKGLLKSEVRRYFENLVKHRRVKVLFLDEGSATISEHVNRHPLRQFEILKSLAVNTGLIVVLVGAYDLAGIHAEDSNGQLLRRSHIVHMERYRPDPERLELARDGKKWQLPEGATTEDDLKDFNDAAQTLALASPVKWEPGVLNDVAYLATRSVGCIGLFREWVSRASFAALATNGGLITQELFDSKALRNKQLERVPPASLLDDHGYRLIAG